MAARVAAAGRVAAALRPRSGGRHRRHVRRRRRLPRHQVRGARQTNYGNGFSRVSWYSLNVDDTVERIVSIACTALFGFDDMIRYKY